MIPGWWKLDQVNSTTATVYWPERVSRLQCEQKKPRSRHTNGSPWLERMKLGFQAGQSCQFAGRAQRERTAPGEIPKVCKISPGQNTALVPSNKTWNTRAVCVWGEGGANNTKISSNKANLTMPSMWSKITWHTKKQENVSNNENNQSTRSDTDQLIDKNMKAFYIFKKLKIEHAN